MKLHNRIKMELMSLPENVGLARIAVAAFASECNFDVGELEEIKVAVSEAVSNAIIHGYQRDANGVITLTATLQDNVLEIVVEDEGRGIADLEQALEPGSADDPERMGLGFVFMKSFMDEVDVASEPGRGTRVRMIKKIPRNPQAEN
ncbi:MAG: hypothetical protein PWQ99_490 [Clostridia bacterium]|nr:hypothetical protein [Clostridia bacterium]